jgi:gamma-glutamylcyclotransferase (GGCT)/AIG2-like uncharacterized protein YtfP
MKQKPRLYIAYGSNLNLPQMERRCPTARPVGTAALRNYELLFRGRVHGAVATVEAKAGASVPVLVWNIQPDDEQALDDYEGYPHLYEKRDVMVELGGKSVSAFAYVMTPGHMAGVPADFYLNVIEQGYQAAGFDLAVLSAAVERSAERLDQEYAAMASDFEDGEASGQGHLFALKWRW